MAEYGSRPAGSWLPPKIRLPPPAAAPDGAVDGAPADVTGALDGLPPVLAAGLGLVALLPQATTSRLAMTAYTTPVDRRTGSSYIFDQMPSGTAGLLSPTEAVSIAKAWIRHLDSADAGRPPSPDGCAHDDLGTLVATRARRPDVAR